MSRRDLLGDCHDGKHVDCGLQRNNVKASERARLGVNPLAEAFLKLQKQKVGEH
jgi:hypothetical protein